MVSTAARDPAADQSGQSRLHRRLLLNAKNQARRSGDFWHTLEIPDNSL
jgi:hypothetical protein